MKKKITISLIAVALLTAWLIPMTANAQTKSNPISGLVAAIAQKFGIDQNQLQSFVSQYKEDHKELAQQKMQDRMDNRLDALVKQGEITDAQKQAILSELQTLAQKYPASSLKSMTSDQRKQQFQNEQNDFKSFLQSQGIDPNTLPMFGIRGVGLHGGFWKKLPTPTPSV